MRKQCIRLIILISYATIKSYICKTIPLHTFEEALCYIYKRIRKEVRFTSVLYVRALHYMRRGNWTRPKPFFCRQVGRQHPSSFSRQTFTCHTVGWKSRIYAREVGIITVLADKGTARDSKKCIVFVLYYPCSMLFCMSSSQINGMNPPPLSPVS
jgi:hypothetical protein